MPRRGPRNEVMQVLHTPAKHNPHRPFSYRTMFDVASLTVLSESLPVFPLRLPNIAQECLVLGDHGVGIADMGGEEVSTVALD